MPSKNSCRPSITSTQWEENSLRTVASLTQTHCKNCSETVWGTDLWTTFKIPNTSVMYNSFYLWGSHFYSTQRYFIQHPGVRPHESPPDVFVLVSELFWRHEPIAGRSFHCCAWHVDQRSYIYITSLLWFLIDNLFRVELTFNWTCISFYFTFCFYFSNKNELNEWSLFNRRLVVWIQQTTV